MKAFKATILATALLTLTSLAFSQTSKQDRHLTGFNAVHLAGSFDVRITQGSSESVNVEAPANVIDRIITEVDGGTLKIYTKNSNGWHWDNNNKKMIVYVSIKDVTAVSLSGSGDIDFKDGLRAPSLKLSLSGSGDITGKVAVKELESSVGGSGDMTISGSADISNVKVGGSGDFTARNLVTVTSIVRVGGSGDASVNASEKLDISVGGSGDVHYTGSAKNVHTTKSGSGDISKM
ncbi:hypothetical protein A0256_10200 [Mucilaginibacter sp. PAMC 26640]|nr:hypothetical protein A0256_10200 [Mucilaginibacter sp. PAMC 26640]